MTEYYIMFQHYINMAIAPYIEHTALYTQLLYI